MDYLAAVSYFNEDECKWVPEFLDYHSVVGVEHFYMFYAQSDPTKGLEILKPYIDKGLVEFFHAPADNIYHQGPPSFWKATSLSNGKYRWLAYLDTDEFVLPLFKDSIPEFLVDYEKHYSVAINWALFGSSGYKDSPPSQLKDLLHRAESSFPTNKHIKCIADPSKVVDFYGTHLVYCTPHYTVDENHNAVTNPLSDYININKIRINHYSVRSLKDCLEVKAKYAPYKDLEFFNKHDRNEVFDDEIYRRFGQKVEDFHNQIN